MDIIHAVILGAIEGVTEFLPISSTGHLILASELLGIPSSDFLKTFQISVQLGAILSVVLLFWRQLLNFELLKRLFVAFIPTGVLGFALYPFIKSVLLDNPLIVLASLFIGGIILIVFEYFYKELPGDIRTEEVSYAQSFIVGLFQSVAMIPGVSRSAATIIGGLSIGIPRHTIVEFSFLLAVPTMMAATGYDLLKNMSLISSENLGTLSVGFIVSFVVALLSIRFLLAFVRKHSFVPFGIYRVVLAAVFFLIVF